MADELGLCCEATLKDGLLVVVYQKPGHPAEFEFDYPFGEDFEDFYHDVVRRLEVAHAIDEVTGADDE